VEKSGVSYEYAGTHGNCDTSNCASTPADKVNFVLGWDRGDWNVTGNVNYRGKMKNVYFEGDLCASQLANGSPARQQTAHWHPSQHWTCLSAGKP
jgi:iron complex outermembrane receptor protein